MKSYVSPLKLETSSLSLSVGDILSFTISNVTDTDYGLRVCAHNADNDNWYGDVVKSVPATEDGVITIVVDEAIKTAAETELWINGNFTLTAVDIESQNIWTGSQEMTSYESPLKLNTSSLSLTAGDLLTFTISTVTDTGYGLRVCAHQAGNDNWFGDVVKSVSATATGVVKMVIDNDIITAAATELWINGNFTLTSIDVEKAADVNVLNESYTPDYNYKQLNSANLLYAKAGDVLSVTISAVGDNEGWRKLYLHTTAEQPSGADASTILYTYGDGDMKVGTIDITLTADMITNIQNGSFYIGGYEFTLSSIDLYLTSPTVTINASAGYATFGYPAALDLTGIDAYTVTVSGTTATLNSVKGKKIPAGTGIILEGSGDVRIPLTTETTNEIGTNHLHISDGTVTGDGTIYVLANKTPVGFYKLSSSATVPAGKAYLKISASGAALAPAFIGFGDGTTGIQTIDNGKLTNDDVYYDLQGRRVAQPTKGLYIVNGKKVIIK